MPTTKTRINLTVPRDVDLALQRIAKRDARSVATTALDLLRHALEVEEDVALSAIADAREKKRGKLVSHAAAWE